MTNREAVQSEIEPYSLSEEAVDKSFMDAAGQYAYTGDVEDDYEYSGRKVVALAAILCLDRLRSLASENIGGISQSYDVRRILARMKAIASQNGIDASAITDVASGNEDRIRYISW